MRRIRKFINSYNEDDSFYVKVCYKNSINDNEVELLSFKRLRTDDIITEDEWIKKVNNEFVNLTEPSMTTDEIDYFFNPPHENLETPAGSSSVMHRAI